MFGNWKNVLGGAVKKVSGNKDFLEAVCASVACVSAADGTISDAEVESGIKAVLANATLAGAFEAREIEATAERMFKRAQGGRVGKLGLMNEIGDIAKNPEMAEVVLLSAIDCAEGDEGISDKERAELDKIAGKLGLDLKKYL